jgi:predicted dehydrogenase
VEQNIAGDSPDEIDASGAAALHVQKIIEAIIESWETGTVVTI